MSAAHLMAERPVWRGRLHSWSFLAAVPAGALLLVLADGALARTAAALYVGSLLAVFGTSAAYHRLAHSLRARQILQRLDHSMIYLLIAGTYVPLCLVVLPPAWGVPLLVVVGAAAVVGVVLKLVAFGRLRWLSYSLYPIMGWSAVAVAPALWKHLATGQLLLVIGGGLAYTVGLPVFALRRPNPWPTVFGYHEIWHAFTVLAAGLHFAAVASFLI